MNAFIQIQMTFLILFYYTSNVLFDENAYLKSRKKNVLFKIPELILTLRVGSVFVIEIIIFQLDAFN